MLKKKVPVFISRWADYSDRFGFVFQLSNGGLVVLCNDRVRLREIQNHNDRFHTVDNNISPFTVRRRVSEGGTKKTGTQPLKVPLGQAALHCLGSRKS